MQNVYTVAQVNSYIKNMFTQDYMLQSVIVKGEVSNCKYHTSGHIYFTLKDRSGTIACVMFAGNRSGLAFKMEEGMQIQVYGSIEVYERDGKYQLYAKQIKLDGQGDLYARFEQLKKELAETGMFAQEYKQKIPTYVKKLGVVTARTGAAVQDIINIASRRNPFVQIILYPAIVQGDAAPASIVNGIRALEQLGVDVIIVGRGGGSIEDLWAFNERIVAQAIFDCSIPIISAVGHETDTTIADYVADLRAPTPSAAAELAVMDIRDLYASISHYKDSLNRDMSRCIREARLQALDKNRRMRLLNPMAKIRDRRNRVSTLQSDMERAMEKILRDRRERFITLQNNLSLAMDNKLQKSQQRMAIYVERMKGVSPLDKLNQGYSYVSDGEGKTLKSISGVKKGDALSVYVSDGVIHAIADNSEKIDYK